MAQVGGARGGPLLTLLHLTHHRCTYSTYCLSSRLPGWEFNPNPQWHPDFRVTYWGSFRVLTEAAPPGLRKSRGGGMESITQSYPHQPSFYIGLFLHSWFGYQVLRSRHLMAHISFETTPPTSNTQIFSTGQHICLGTSVVILTPDYILSPR